VNVCIEKKFDVRQYTVISEAVVTVGHFKFTKVIKIMYTVQYSPTELQTIRYLQSPLT